MNDAAKINTTTETFDLRLRIASMIAELHQMTVMITDEHLLAWKKNKEFDLVRATEQKLKVHYNEQSAKKDVAQNR